MMKKVVATSGIVWYNVFTEMLLLEYDMSYQYYSQIRKHIAELAK